MSENPEFKIQNTEGTTPLPSAAGGRRGIYWTVIATTVFAWLGLLAFLIHDRIRQFCTVVEPDNYVTWPKFQIMSGLYIRLPLLFPLLILALWGQHHLLRKYGR